MWNALNQSLEVLFCIYFYLKTSFDALAVLYLICHIFGFDPYYHRRFATLFTEKYSVCINFSDMRRCLSIPKSSSLL